MVLRTGQAQFFVIEGDDPKGPVRNGTVVKVLPNDHFIVEEMAMGLPVNVGRPVPRRRAECWVGADGIVRGRWMDPSE